MKIKCIKLLDSDGNHISYSPWLKLGSVYHVLSIDIDIYRNINYGIVPFYVKDEWPSYISVSDKCFDIVSDIVPKNWDIKINKSGYISISPASWQKGNFFEDFSNREPYTYEIFKSELNLILEEDHQ